MPESVVQVAHSTKTGENQKHELHEDEMERTKVGRIQKVIPR